jgi:hypothetical protein
MRIRLLLEEARVLSNWKFGPRGLHSRNAKVITWRAKHLTVRTAYVPRSMVLSQVYTGHNGRVDVKALERVFLVLVIYHCDRRNHVSVLV